MRTPIVLIALFFSLAVCALPATEATSSVDAALHGGVVGVARIERAPAGLTEQQISTKKQECEVKGTFCLYGGSKMVKGGKWPEDFYWLYCDQKYNCCNILNDELEVFTNKTSEGGLRAVRAPVDTMDHKKYAKVEMIGLRENYYGPYCDEKPKGYCLTVDYDGAYSLGSTNGYKSMSKDTSGCKKPEDMRN